MSGPRATGDQRPSPLPVPRTVRVGLIVVLLGCWGWLFSAPGAGEGVWRGIFVGAGLLALILGLSWPRLPLARLPVRLREGLSRALEEELPPRRRWLALLVVYLAPRAFLLLDDSYGADPDAWRVAVSGLKLWRDHVYEASRLPGYPLTEIGLAPAVVLGGPVVAKLVVAAAGFLGLMAFDRLARELGAPRAGLATLALALSPLYVVSSSSAMDYVPALAVALGAMSLLAAGRHFWGGATLGLAAGFRPTTAALALPMAIWARLGGAKWREVGLFALTVAEAGALAFVPVLAAYRTAFVPESAPELEGGLASGAALGALGLLPTIAMGLVLGEGLRQLRAPGPPSVAPWLAGGALVTGLALFAILPIQAGYLLPALASGLLLLAVLDRPLSLVALSLAFALALPLETLPGSLRGEVATRRAQLDGYAEVRGAAVPAGSVLLLGGAQFALASRLGLDLEPMREQGVWDRALHDPVRDVLLVARLPERAWTKAQQEERQVYVWNPFVDAWTKSSYGYSPIERGARLLHGEVEAPHASVSWRAGPKEAASRVSVEGDLVRISGWSGAPIRVCAEPASPLSEAARLLGEVRLKGQEGPGRALRVGVAWEDAAGDRVGGVTPLILTSPGPPVPVNERLKPPEGAATARLCVKLEGEGVDAVLDRLRLAP